MTGGEFADTVSFLLFLVYVWEIGYFIYHLEKYTSAFRSFKDADVEHIDLISSTQTFKAGMSIGFFHNLIYAVVYEIINPVLVGAAIGAAFLGGINEIVRPDIKRIKKGTKGPPDPEPGTAQQGNEDEGFGFDPGRFRQGTSGGTWTTEEAEADYDAALIEAQVWADRSATQRTAFSYIRKFEQMSQNPSLGPKDRLRYKLAVMLLKERLKGQAEHPSRSTHEEPTNADLKRLGLPTPPEPRL